MRFIKNRIKKLRIIWKIQKQIKNNNQLNKRIYIVKLNWMDSRIFIEPICKTFLVFERMAKKIKNCKFYI